MRQQNGQVSAGELSEVARRVLESEPSRKQQLESELATAKQHHESVEKEMATPDFFAFFNNIVFPLKCDSPNDELSYALGCGSVWSSAHDLKPEQWKLLDQGQIAG